ncbi:uncharacterized protein LOC129747403 [Uranotaenia lowii]|uniref:uncharacterized protein LOC129747403 n=1 Tax=Uranotaenia lowii TaxID=190385 RepID=UPI0024799AD5|nr:uncharacterized protein LOC129747403 [Uranotaenia lowii]
MKLFIASVLLAFVALGSAQSRQSSIDALTKLREAIPEIKYVQDSAVLKVSEAKQKASNALNNFYHNVFATKTDLLQQIIKEESEVMEYGKALDSWCWENNVPKLEGIMGWIGIDFSNCIKALDNSISGIVATIYGQFQTDESNINKYSLFEVFERRNIINNPQSVLDAIANLQLNVDESVPEFDQTIREFEDDLNAKIPSYTSCMNQQMSMRRMEIQNLKDETQLCLELQ